MKLKSNRGEKIKLGLIGMYPKLGKCEMTASGKHLFMPIDDKEAKIWIAHGVKNPMRCIVCNLVNDLDE